MRAQSGTALAPRLAEATAALGIAVLTGGLTWVFAHYGAARGAGAAAAVLVVLWLLTTRRTLLALACLMAYLGMVDGYVKLASGSSAMTLLRDALLFAIVIGVLARAQARSERWRLPPLSFFPIAFAIVVLAGLANPLDGTLSHSLGGVRQHLEFVPLFFLTYAFVRSVKALRAFVVLMLVIACANAVVNLIQFNETPQQFAAWGPGYRTKVLGTAELSGRTFLNSAGVVSTRPFGLGGDAGVGGLMAAYAVGAALAFAALAARRRRQQLLAAALALGVVVAIYTSEGRSNIVAGLVIAITFGMLTLHSRRRVVSMFALAAVGLVAFALVQAAITGLGGGATRFKGLGPTALLSTTDQARGGSIAEIPQLLVSYPLGAGLGVAGPASSTSGGPVATRNINAESEVAFLIDETGIPGLLVMTGFLITLFVIAVRRCPRIEDRETRLLLAATVAPIGAILPLWLTGGGLTATVPGGPFIWAIGGIVSYWLIRREEAA